MEIDFKKKIKNTNKFRVPAITFQKTGQYCVAPKGTTEYVKYWEEEQKKCVDGWHADDGDFISGYNYFYLNYCPILRLVDDEVVLSSGQKKVIKRRERAFADFWDYDYYYFLAVQAAEEEGKHMVLLKKRGVGASFKGASMLARNYSLIPGSRSYAVAAEAGFLIKDGLLTKCWDMLDFLSEHTPWGKLSQAVNTKTHRRASYLITDEFGKRIEQGYKSEVIGVTLKNDPQKLRGMRCKLMIFEEAGKFPDITIAWRIAQAGVEESGIAFGLMVAQGCVCAGTKVWDKNGNLINIEDVTDSIIGFDGNTHSKEEVTYHQPKAYKECVRIELEGSRHLECSCDHPLMTNTSARFDKNKTLTFKRAEDLTVNNYLVVPTNLNLFGTKRMWHPRLVGLMIGDGNYTRGVAPTISVNTEELYEYLNSNFDIGISKLRAEKSGNVYAQVYFRGKEIQTHLEELGIYGQVKEGKRLPDNIGTYCREDICEMIGGYFDADGNVQIVRSGPIIKLTCKYKEMLEQVRYLLLQLGVISSIHAERMGGSVLKSSVNNKVWNMPAYTCHVLYIHNRDSVRKFAENIRFISKAKQCRIEGYVPERIQHIYHGCNFEKTIDKGDYFVGKQINNVALVRIKSVTQIGVKRVYNLTANTTHTYIANGFVGGNTGGAEDSNFEGLKEMFYNGQAYNVKMLPNVWDEGAENTVCGFFVPEYVNMTTPVDHPVKLMDKEGNTNYEAAIEYAKKLREPVLKYAKDRTAIDRYVAEHPFTPQEACLSVGINIFPRSDLLKQLAFIRTHKEAKAWKHVGHFDMEDGKPVWVNKKGGDITLYPLPKHADPTGAVVIWEHPMDNPPHGLYIMGTDPLILAALI